MKRLLFLAPILLLSGCLATAPVTMKFPEIPEELKTSCPNLKTIEPGTTQLSKVLPVITDNYSSYHECKLKVDTWLDWYNGQKKIFEEVK